MVDMKYVAYYRVSSKEQGDSGLGLESQQYSVRKRFPNLDREFIEVKSGRLVSKRPIFQEAVAYCQKTGATLVVYRIDRLCRNTKEALEIYELLGGNIIFCNLGAEKARKLIITIFFALAEEESSLNSERTTLALAAKKRRGEKLGNPANFTQSGRNAGARVQAERARVSPDNERAQSHALLLRKDGLPFSEVAKKLNEAGFRTSTGGQWCTSTVHRVVQRMGAGR